MDEVQEENVVQGDANENHGSVPQNQQAVENRFASSDDESSSSESSESEPENWKLESKKGSEVDDEDVNDPSGDEASKTSEKLEKHSDNHEDVSTDTEEQPEPASKANVEAGKAELGFDQEKDGKNLPSEDHSDAESDSDKSSTSSSEQNSDEDELDLHKDNSIPHANIDQNSDEDHPQPTGDGKEHLKPDDDAKSSESESPQFKDLDSEFHKNLEREKPVTNFDENLDKTDTASSAPSSENMLPIEAEKDLQPYSGDQVGLESSGNDQLHGNNFESPSSSSSDDDEGGPLVVRQQPEIHEMPQEVPGDFGGRLPSIDRRNTNYSPPPVAVLNGKPPIELTESDEPSDVEDSCIRARRAEDFSQPPELPPKLRSKSSTAPRNTGSTPPPQIFNVGDKTASLRRGMWSDEEVLQPPSAYAKRPKHSRLPPPDRVIDFSQPKSPKKHRGKSKRKKSNDNSLHGIPTRIVDVPRGEVRKRPATVSLHSGAADELNDGNSDFYDSDRCDVEDLNQLIRQANSMELNPHADGKTVSVDVVYPSYQRSLPRQKDLSSTFPEVFSKLAVNQEQEIPVVPVEEAFQFSAVSLGPELPPKLSRDAPRKQYVDPLDGDDEVSSDEINARTTAAPAQPSKTINVMPFIVDKQRSDYSDSDSQSEIDDTENEQAHPVNSNVSPYYPVTDSITDESVNPIVNADYQICTDFNKNRNTFPKRLKSNQATPKERPTIDAIAIPLTDPLSGPNRRDASLPYQEKTVLKRNNSEPEISSDNPPVSLFGQMPPIVVTRGSGTQYSPRSASSEGKLPSSQENNEKVTGLSNPAAQQVHLSLGSNADGSSMGNANNLQINVLPSDDPNIINLNITARNPSSNSLPPSANFQNSPSSATDQLEPSPLQVQPIVPMTVVQHRLPSSVDSESSLPLQHRVVDMPTMMVDTTDPLPQPEIEETVAKQPPLPLYPTLIQPPVQVMQPVMEPAIEPQQVPTTAVQPPVMVTAERSLVSVNPSAPPQNMVVEVQSPWPENQRSLPEQPPDKGLRHGGDSGIDLANYDRRNRTRRNSDSDTSASSDYDMERSPSKRRLQSADELAQHDLSEKYIEWYENKYMKPTCCYYFLKHFAFVLNLIFLLVGLALLALGLWGFIDMLVEGLNDPVLLLYDPIFPVLIAGIFVTLTCFYGAAGFLRDSVCMIKFFGACLIILCLIFVGGGICFWIMRETVTQFTTNAFANLVGHYNYTTRKSASFTIDQIQANFGCCGFKGVEDWKRASAFTCVAKQACDLPQACCATQTDVTCTSIRGDRHPLGCMDQLVLWVRDNTPLLIGVWLGIIVLFLINFVSVYFMLKEVRYLQLIREKIFSIVADESCVSSEVTSDSEYDESVYHGRHRKRRTRGEYHVNPAYG